MTNGTTCKATGTSNKPHAWRRLLRLWPLVARFLLTLLWLNTSLELAARLGSVATPAQELAVLMQTPLRDLAFGLSSVHTILDGLMSSAPAVLLTWLLLCGLVLAAVLRLRVGAVAGLLLAFSLIHLTLRSTGSDLWGDLRAVPLLYLALPPFLFGCVMTLCITRWGLLLRVQGVHMSFWARARLTLIGMFFNLAIPGAVSGDLLKMAYITRHTQERKAEAILTIMLDRVIGLLGLLVVAACAVLWSLPMLLSLPEEYSPIRAAAVLVALGSLGGVGAVCLLEARERLLRIPPLAHMVDAANRRLPDRVSDTLARFIHAIELYRERRGTIVKALVLATAVHAILGLNLLCIGRIVGERSVSPGGYFVTTQVSNVVGAVPVTPGGVGTRDATTALFLRAFGASPPDKIGTIPLVVTLCMVFWGLVGAAVFVFRPPPALTPAAVYAAPTENDAEEGAP